jgi:hypothetical protein
MEAGKEEQEGVAVGWQLAGSEYFQGKVMLGVFRDRQTGDDGGIFEHVRLVRRAGDGAGALEEEGRQVGRQG